MTFNESYLQYLKEDEKNYHKKAKNFFAAVVVSGIVALSSTLGGIVYEKYDSSTNKPTLVENYEDTQKTWHTLKGLEEDLKRSKEDIDKLSNQKTSRTLEESLVPYDKELQMTINDTERNMKRIENDSVYRKFISKRKGIENFFIIPSYLSSLIAIGFCLAGYQCDINRRKTQLKIDELEN